MRAPGCRPSWLLGIHQHKQNSARLRAVTGDFVLCSGRAAAGQKKERSGLQSACDELIDKGAFR
jgi:hypothetical protein